VRTRSFNHTGAGQALDFALPSWADQLVRRKLAGEKRAEVATGDLDVERDYSGVTAVVGAYRTLLEKGASGDVFNVCSGRAQRLGSLLERLGAIAGVEPVARADAARLRRAEVRTVRGDPSRLESVTGLSLARSLDRDLEALVRATEERLRG
jgi:GDP-4-dehydro-6-deoxy-D-mannose reductase